MNGDDGVDRVENNLAAADDVSTLKIENGRVRYDRLNPRPFNLSIGTAEVFELNTLGGNDTLTTDPRRHDPARRRRRRGQRHASRAAPATTSIDGGDGNDTIEHARRRRRLRPRRRGHRPRPTVDAIDAVAADVETVDRPQAAARPPAPQPARRLAPRPPTVKKGVAALKVSCPAGISGLQGHRDAARPRRSRPARQGRSARPQATRSKAGESKTVKIKLAKGTAKLAKKQEADRQGPHRQRRAGKTAKLTLASVARHGCF